MRVSGPGNFLALSDVCRAWRAVAKLPSRASHAPVVRFRSAHSSSLVDPSIPTSPAILTSSIAPPMVLYTSTSPAANR
ncbi:hypothetical protein AXF42_Ash008785 [Apostasia shenzhenica]|uniref:F-box protein n=1 Tax=Apostasia shenzhenica TaxID=1088818 RepID=A0A2I0ASG8_9ASPA|nr:hypothetical protein AXF42_Ash008785 [Apostasia shenzhenica]